MLYAHAGSSKPQSDGERSEFGELGLGSTVPHVANLYSSTPAGGGSYTVASGGGQAAGDPGGGAVPVAGSSGAGFRPVGRNTSVFQGGKGAAPVKGRNLYQATAQGSRVSGGEAAVPTAVKGRAGASATFPSGGLFGADERDIGLAGFFNDLFKGNIKKAFTPPGGKITRIQPLGFVAQVLPTPLRTAARNVGAAVQSTLLPVLTGAQQRQMFGLSPGESAVFNDWSKAGRMLYAAVATYGAGAWLAAGSPVIASGGSAAGAAAAAPAGAALAAPAAAGGSQLSIVTGLTSWAPTSAGSAVWSAPVATSATFGGSVASVIPAAGSAVWQAPTVAEIVSQPIQAPAVAGAGLMNGGALAPAATSPGFWSGVGGAAKTIAESTAQTILLSKILGGGGRAPDQQQQDGGVPSWGSGQQQTQPQAAPIPIGYSGGGASGGSTDSSQDATPVMAGMSLPGLITVAAIVVAVGVKVLRRNPRHGRRR